MRDDRRDRFIAKGGAVVNAAGNSGAMIVSARWDRELDMAQSQIVQSGSQVPSEKPAAPRLQSIDA